MKTSGAFPFAGLFAGLLLLNGSAFAGEASAPLMKILITPSAMDQTVNKGEVKVTITLPGVDAPANEALFGGTTGPDLTVTDSQGPVTRVPVPAEAQPAAPRAQGGRPGGGPGGRGGNGRGNEWTPARAVKGDLKISYTLAVENTATNGGTTPVRPRIDGKSFSAIGSTLLPNIRLKTPYRILIAWDLKAMGPGAIGVSSAGDGDAEMPVGSLSRLGRLCFMAGDLKRETYGSKFAAVWGSDPGFDMNPPMQWTGKLHEYMMKFFNTPNDPAYRVFLRINGAGNPGGGVAFPNAFFATYGPGVTGENLKQILGHEMTHTFTANNLGKWYDEGDAVYYQVRLPWLNGMATTEQYLNDINKTAARYYTNAEMHTQESELIPKFFSDPWLNTLGYDRGALYFAVLNGKIRRASGGKRSVDDLVRVMVHKERVGEEITEQTWVDLLRKELGEDGVKVHTTMMDGTGTLIPESDDYGPCFSRYTTKIRRYELGFKSKRNDAGKTEITEMVAGSEADKAGLKVGDLVVLPIITTEGVKRDPKATVTIGVTRGGKEFSVTYLPRGDAFDAYQWKRVANVPESACKKGMGL